EVDAQSLPFLCGVADHMCGEPRARRLAARGVGLHLFIRHVGPCKREVHRSSINVALRDRASFCLIGIEQFRRSPTLQNALQLPTEIDRIAKTRVHAVAAVGCIDVAGIARKINAPSAVAFRDQPAASPGKYSINMVRDVSASETA